jgi:hypothetical protein
MRGGVSAPLFRKTSCAESFAHGLPDYNGHAGIPELCDTCPVTQLNLCRSAHRMPTSQQLHKAAGSVPEGRGLVVLDITDRVAAPGADGPERPPDQATAPPLKRPGNVIAAR